MNDFLHCLKVGKSHCAPNLGKTSSSNYGKFPYFEISQSRSLRTGKIPVWEIP